MCHAVRNVSGNAAASTKPIASGMATRFCDGHAHELGVAAVALRSQHVVPRALVVAALETRVAASARQARLQHHPASGRACSLSDDSTISPATSAPEMCGSGRRTTPRAVPHIEMIERARAHADQRPRPAVQLAGRARLRSGAPPARRAREIGRLSCELGAQHRCGSPRFNDVRASARCDRDRRPRASPCAPDRDTAPRRG